MARFKCRDALYRAPFYLLHDRRGRRRSHGISHGWNFYVAHPNPIIDKTIKAGNINCLYRLYYNDRPDD